MFTFNGKGGCPVCGGKGVIVSDMAFMDSIETVCEACGGLRYSPGKPCGIQWMVLRSPR